MITGLVIAGRGDDVAMILLPAVVPGMLKAMAVNLPASTCVMASRREVPVWAAVGSVARVTVIVDIKDRSSSDSRRRRCGGGGRGGGGPFFLFPGSPGAESEPGGFRHDDLAFQGGTRLVEPSAS